MPFSALAVKPRKRTGAVADEQEAALMRQAQIAAIGMIRYAMYLNRLPEDRLPCATFSASFECSRCLVECTLDAAKSLNGGKNKIDAGRLIMNMIETLRWPQNVAAIRRWKDAVGKLERYRIRRSKR